MTLLVAISDWQPDVWAKRLAALMPKRDIRVFPDLGDRADILYALVWKPEPGLLKSLPNLKAIFSLGAGVDHILADRALPDVPIVRIVDADMTMRMGEHVVAHVLLHHRRLLAYREQQRERRWQELRQPPASSVNVGLMGLGELGRDAATKLAAVGFNIAGWSRTPKDIPGVACFAGPAGLGGFLARTDILVALLPLTADTRGILNRTLFARLRRDGPLGGAVLINAGRGELQVEGDILAALNAGELKAASLDVFEKEPLADDSPLWAHPCVVVTPHVAAVSDGHALTRYIADQITAFEAGKPLQNVVDVERGY